MYACMHEGNSTRASRMPLQVIFNEAFDQVRLDGDILYALGTPLKAFGADHGSERGRRNAIDRWEVEEGGEELSVVRDAERAPSPTHAMELRSVAVYLA
eukprot:2687105-Pleurochrysis_carterae.AAC.4